MPLLNTPHHRATPGDHDLRTSAVPQLEEILARRECLELTGFTRAFIDQLFVDKPTGFSADWVQATLAGLRERGFADPVKLITSLPPVLGYGFENIDEKIKILDRCFTQYAIPLDAQDTLTTLPTILGTKNDKIWTIAKILRAHSQSGDEITMAVLNTCLFTALPLLLLAHHEYPSADIKTLIQKARGLKKAVPKDAIPTRLAEHSVANDKTHRRYLRGYSK